MNRQLLARAALAAVALAILQGCNESAANPPPVAAPAAAPAAVPPVPPVPPAEAKGSPLHFEPTEKTRADFELSLPNDI
jgi:hypothetical protein